MVTADNYAKLATAIVSWLKPRAMALLKQQQSVIKINEYLRGSDTLKSFVGLLGLDLRNYSVIDELGFLIEPVINRYGSTKIVGMLKKVDSDDNIILTSKDIVNSAITEAENRPNKKINLFGVILDMKDLIDLKGCIDNIDNIQ